MSDLKPCPFCGGEVPIFADHNHSSAWEVGCFNDNCRVKPSVWEKTKAEAIAAWNTSTNHFLEASKMVAEALERAAAMVEGSSYTSSPGGVRSLEPVSEVLRGMDQHHATIAAAIRALIPPALAERKPE